MIGSSDLAPKELKADEVIRDCGKADDRNLSKSKKLKNAKFGIQTQIGAMEELTFRTFGNKKPLTNWDKCLPKPQSSITLI